MYGRAVVAPELASLKLGVSWPGSTRQAGVARTTGASSRRSATRARARCPARSSSRAGDRLLRDRLGLAHRALPRRAWPAGRARRADLGQQLAAQAAGRLAAVALEVPGQRDLRLLDPPRLVARLERRSVSARAGSPLAFSGFLLVLPALRLRRFGLTPSRASSVSDAYVAPDQHGAGPAQRAVEPLDPLQQLVVLRSPGRAAGAGGGAEGAVPGRAAAPAAGPRPAGPAASDLHDRRPGERPARARSSPARRSAEARRRRAASSRCSASRSSVSLASIRSRIEVISRSPSASAGGGSWPRPRRRLAGRARAGAPGRCRGSRSPSMRVGLRVVPREPLDERGQPRPAALRRPWVPGRRRTRVRALVALLLAPRLLQAHGAVERERRPRPDHAVGVEAVVALERLTAASTSASSALARASQVRVADPLRRT